jgi:hypothetical protein
MQASLHWLRQSSPSAARGDDASSSSTSTAAAGDVLLAAAAAIILFSSLLLSARPCRYARAQREIETMTTAATLTRSSELEDALCHPSLLPALYMLQARCMQPQTKTDGGAAPSVWVCVSAFLEDRAKLLAPSTSY